MAIDNYYDKGDAIPAYQSSSSTDNLIVPYLGSGVFSIPHADQAHQCNDYTSVGFEIDQSHRSCYRSFDASDNAWFVEQCRDQSLARYVTDLKLGT